MAAMLLRGNARCEKLMMGGRLVGLQFLHPDRLTWFRRDGVKVWRYTDENGLQREIPNDRIWGYPGSPWTVWRASLSLVTVQRYSAPPSALTWRQAQRSPRADADHCYFLPEHA